MHRMVSFQEPSQWVLPVPELTVMMPWHATKPQEKPDNTLLTKENLTLLNL